MIVVTAAGGPTGTAVVRALWSRGEQVRAVVGSDRPHPELAALSVEIATADLTAPAQVGPLLAGARALHLIWPNFDPDETAGATALLAAAARAGVPRVVYHSVLRPQARSMPHHAAKDLVEEALDASGLAWRVLQPCAYGANLDRAVADAVATGRFASTWGLDRAQSLVDLGDVADAAAVLLTEDGLDGGTFEVVGPQPLTAPRIAGLLSGRLGREIAAVDVPPEGPVPPAAEYAAHCRRRMLDHYRAHGFTGSPRVLEALLGRPARTFGQHLDRLLPALATASPDRAGGRP